MSAREHSFYEESIGAWLLGALPRLEAEVFERHLMGCESCRAEVDRLRPVLDALPGSVPQVSPPRGLKRDVVAAARADAARAKSVAERPRRRLRPALVPALGLASAVLGLAGLGVASLNDGATTRTIAAAVDAKRLSPAAQARLEVASDGRIALLQVSNMPSPGGGRVYELWVRRAGRVVPAGTFTVNASGRASAEIPHGLRGVRAVMVTRERVGGAPRPTERPVVMVLT